MNFKDRIVNWLGGVPKTNNSLGTSFLQTGGRNFGGGLTPNWKEVNVTPLDAYKGYSYAAIQIRGNRVATLAKTNLNTWATKQVTAKYQDLGVELEHPYLKVIRNSRDFSEKKFWKDISIYLDLAGRYYLGVVRSKVTYKNEDYMSDVVKFVMINPYRIKRILNSKGQLGGYLETRKDGLSREWPVHQIIEMTELNPIDEDDVWSMTQAAQPAIYTLQQSGDYTRHSLRGNLNAPGIITTDVILEDQQFENFRSRILTSGKGEPLFGNGAGSIKWQTMQTDLDKAALMDINEMNRNEFFAVSGTSKTVLGIEESGTTRETARVQIDNFNINSAQPRLEDIIDFLNLDYKRYYERDYKRYQYMMEVLSSVSRDYEGEMKSVELRGVVLDLVDTMVMQGYDRNDAIAYATGRVELVDLPAPKEIITDQTQLQESPDETPEDTDINGVANSAQPEPAPAPAPAPGPGPAPLPDGPEPPDSDLYVPPGKPRPKPFPRPRPQPPLEGDAQEIKHLGGTENPPMEPVVHTGWLAVKLPSVDVKSRLVNNMLDHILSPLSNITTESTNVPGEDNAHITLFYGLMDLSENCRKIEALLAKNPIKSVKITEISHFDTPNGYAIIAKVEKSPELMKLRKKLEKLPHEEQKFPDYTPHMTICYIDSIDSDGKAVNPEDFYPIFEDLVGKEIKTLGYLSDGLTVDIRIDKDDSQPQENLKVEEFIDEDVYKNDISSNDIKVLNDAFNTTLSEIRQVQDKLIESVINKVNLNSFSEEDILSEDERVQLQQDLENIVEKYWWILIPLFAKANTDKRNLEFKLKQEDQVKFTLTEEIKSKLKANAKKVSIQHIDTIVKDLLSSINKTYTKIVEDATIKLIIDGYSKNPTKFEPYFKKAKVKDSSPENVRKVIKKTDILDKNRKIYEKAEKMALEGYGRDEIIKAIKEQHQTISKNRATLIARNETARAYSNSQYQADLQFLNITSQLQNAYKQLYSRTGTPCVFCQAIIDAGPIPFTQNFLSFGDSIEVEQNGKTSVFNANYEDIEAGSVHPNCHCSYRLIIKNDVESNEIKNIGDDSSFNSLSHWLETNAFCKHDTECNCGSCNFNREQEIKAKIINGSKITLISPKHKK